MMVDLERQVIDVPGMAPVPFQMDPRVRNKLLGGLDDLDELQQHGDDARTKRSADRAARPWIYQSGGGRP
jgi:hypothetical protein